MQFVSRGASDTSVSTWVVVAAVTSRPGAFDIPCELPYRRVAVLGLIDRISEYGASTGACSSPTEKHVDQIPRGRPDQDACIQGQMLSIQGEMTSVAVE